MVAIPDELARLQAMPRDELHIVWRRHFHSPPPRRVSRDLMLRAIAYKLQERVHGGLSQAAKRALRDVSSATGREGANGSLIRAATALKPGVRLARDWGGKAHTVLVLEDGFDYRGQRYRSLSEIAKTITGAHWSGPRFFGLTRTGKGQGAAEGEGHASA